MLGLAGSDLGYIIGTSPSEWIYGRTAPRSLFATHPSAAGLPQRRGTKDIGSKPRPAGRGIRADSGTGGRGAGRKRPRENSQLSAPDCGGDRRDGNVSDGRGGQSRSFE